MDNDKWRRILDLAHAAADLPRGERSGFLRASCDEDDVVERALELADEFESEPEGPELRPGSHVEHFIVEEEIGRGGMGCVYSAHDTDLERTVALKILRREAVGSSPANSIVREARAASALNHPNIVTVYEVIRDEGAVILVMEYVSGRSLRDLVSEPPALNRILRIAHQVAAALNAAHSARIVHRDIKPENVIVREDGHVKVLDFGLARSFRQSEVTSMSAHQGLAGTLRYMPPERCTGNPATPAGDIFALGLVLYELSTGQHPFAGETPVDTMHAILHQPAAAPSSLNGSLPSAFDSLLLSMLAKVPADRPDAAQLMLAIESLQLGDSAATLAEKASSQAISVTLLARVVRRPWLAGLMALLAIVVTWGLWKQNSRSPQVVRSERFTNQTPANRLTAAAISRDGRFTAYATADGIFVRNPSGENQQLRAPEGFVVDHLAWYANGTALAVSGFSDISQRPSVWMVSISGNAPQLVQDGVRWATPSPDGRRIAFISGDYAQIRVGDVNGEHLSSLIGVGAPDAFLSIWWSSTGTHLIAQRRHFSGKDRGPVTLDRYYERKLQSISVETGKVVFESPDLWIDSATVLKDGRLRFLRYDQPGAYYAKSLWEVRSDPDTGAFHEEPINLGNPVPVYGAYAASLSSTDDGRHMVVIRSSDEDSVYVADFLTTPPRLTNHRRLTLNSSRNFPHAWTADSQAVIYEASPDVSWDLFLQPLAKRFPVKLTTSSAGAEVLPQLTPDGKSVLYASARVNDTSKLTSVMLIPLSGGTPVPVPIGDSFGEFRCSTSPRGRCVIRKPLGHESFVFYELDPVHGIGQELARTAWQPAIVGDWDISPDGTWVAFPNHDPKSAVIRVIPLHPHGTVSREEELPLPGLSDLFGVVWTANGNNWLVSLATTVGRRTILAGRDGKVFPLGNFQGSVPSPDGKKLAYVDHITASDGWDVDVR